MLLMTIACRCPDVGRINRHSDGEENLIFPFSLHGELNKTPVKFTDWRTLLSVSVVLRQVMPAYTDELRLSLIGSRAPVQNLIFQVGYTWGTFYE
jgi:hypothetical protein